MPLKRKLLTRLKGEMVLTLARTFVARGIAALGALFLVMVLGRTFGPTGVGIYALAHSIILGIGLLSRYGMDNALMRYVGQDIRSPHAMTYLFWACRRAVLLSLMASVLMFLMRSVLVEVFEAGGLGDVLVGMAVAAPAFTLGFLLSGFFKGVRMPATACLLENGSVALMAAVLLWGWRELVSEPQMAAIGWAYAAAAWGVLLQGCWQLWRWHRQRRRSGEWSDAVMVDRYQFTATSQAFFVMSLASFMQTVLGIMVAGWLLSSAELGHFKTAQQAAMLISFILIVLNAVIPPRFASLYREGKDIEMGRLARQGALLGVVVASPLLFICLVVPEWVLSLFGAEFSEAVTLLRVIALAQLINVGTGSVGFLLNMTGHETLMRNVALICNAVGLGLFLVLIPALGPMGAALALAFVLVVQNLVALFFVWRRLGIWMLPTPNVLRLAGIQPLSR
ncbi:MULTISPECIES: oligosaccharide flippase family protein [unclassified Halomonas]|uniref:lipopolysaccharide biosynthesis protein n=1 Tax=unclassified Halomonas TaxID=2609666 RepID=UPI0024688C08|nr:MULTISPECIES: oligosaccharide flippase family protein [unclassified Halomonas]